MHTATSKHIKVNDVRREINGDGRAVTTVPPTLPALQNQVKRTTFIGGHLWRSNLHVSNKLPIFTKWGRKFDGDALEYQYGQHSQLHQKLARNSSNNVWRHRSTCAVGTKKTRAVFHLSSRSSPTMRHHCWKSCQVSI